MLIVILGASLLVIMLPGKGMNREGEGIFRAGYGSKVSSIKNKNFKC